jgi:dTDP-3-amino-3,4,6-trideoxy-alpha-D-glucose transaminase
VNPPAPATAARPREQGGPLPLLRLDDADPALLEELMDAVRGVASRSAFTLGSEVDAFEGEFADYCGSAEAIGVSSGTEALGLALRALDLGPGDEVLVPANSFIATAEAVTLAGAVPRFVDVDPTTGLLTPAILEEALAPATRAVIPVHLHGATVDMPAIMPIAARWGVRVVEDVAQATGAWIDGRRVGTFGDCGCFSFFPTKNLGAWGDGGAVVSDDADVARQVRLLRSHGEDPAERHRHRMPGTTARLDAIQAAVLRVKLARLDEWNVARRMLAASHTERLAGTTLELPDPQAGADHVFHHYVVQSDAREQLRSRLAALDVSSAVHYPTPIHLTEAYAPVGQGPGSLPGAERRAQRICSLPFWPGMDDASAERLVTALDGAVQRAAA